MSDDLDLPLVIPAARVVELATARRLAQCVEEVREAGWMFVRGMLRRGHPVTVTQGQRTDDDCAKLYAMGRTTPSWDAGWPGRPPLGTPVTYAKTAGDTPHGCQPLSAAFDFAFLVDGILVADDPKREDDLHSWSPLHPWELAMEVGEACGLEAGGRWLGKKRDLPHMQAKRWRERFGKRAA